MANHTGKGQFQKGDDPRRNQNGQTNAEAVAFTRKLKAALIAEGNLPYKRGSNVTKYERLIQKIWAKANAGNAWAIQFIAERVEGKVKEQVELSGEIAVKGYANVSPDDWDEANSPD